MVKVLDLRSTGCWFKSQPSTLSSATPGKLFTCVTLLPVQAGKVIIGLVSHWPGLAENSDISTHGLWH